MWNDDIFHSLSKLRQQSEDIPPEGGYHRQCYQRYTNKTLIDKALKKVENSNFNSLPNLSGVSCSESKDDRSVRRSQEAYIWLSHCIICQKDKLIKGTSNYETPSQCITFEASGKLKAAARIRQDTRMMREIQDKDLIALEVKYHRSCCSNYVHKKTLDRLSQQDSEDINVKDIYDAAFEKLAVYIEEHIVKGYDVIRISELREMYVNFLAENDIDGRNYKMIKLKSRFQKKFGKTVSFWTPRYRSELIYSESVPTGLIVEAAVETTKQAKINEGIDGKLLKLKETALTIRNEIKKFSFGLPFPASTMELKESNGEFPELLWQLLCLIITGKDSDLSSSSKRVVTSIAQDIIYATSNGVEKSPKRILLPYTIKSLTGSAEAVTLLNRFGHGISYSQAQELDTSIAVKNWHFRENIQMYLM